jgi:hypothetical protein
MDYRDANYLEVGWGDDDGYRKDLTTGIALKALIHSTRTVLLFDGFDKSLRENFPEAKYTIIEIKLSRRGFERLCQCIERTTPLTPRGSRYAWATTGTGRVAPIVYCSRAITGSRQASVRRVARSHQPIALHAALSFIRRASSVA